ncbi:TetR/AcrR family transcriptional regulator [Acuticoccus kandeliae]|uniref:TetR/AcrR family transcriptional regulator n=1 Tax=Acuticoccus kandeliae TaxID=2073160 RepID=UPI000D3E1F71|nr:TetR/AcrR family transcriptional regulator [Acuticoccus kandeliae]
MRVSRDVAAQNRRKVVETAARSFREHGYDGVGISALMKAAGLTHGGFYKQFADKEALAAEATEAGLRRNEIGWTKALEGVEGDPLEAFAEWYLRDDHVGTRARGCTFAALAAEAPRQGPAIQTVFGEALDRWVGRITEANPDAEVSRAAALKTIATLVGAVILARAVADEEQKAEILAAVRPPAPAET